MTSGDEQAAFVAQALREEMPTLPPERLDKLARVAINATLSWMIEAAKDKKIEVNADSVLKDPE